MIPQVFSGVLLHNILKNYNKDGRDKNSVEDISSCGSCQGSFIHLSCLCESLPSSHHMNTHLHSHPSSACGSASKHLPNGVCCLHFTASLIDLASSVSWRDLHLGQPNLNPSLGCRLKVSNSSDAPFDYFLSPRIWKQGGKIKLLFPPFLLYVLKTLTVHLPFSLRLAVKQKEVKWIKTSKSKAWYQVTHKPW